MEEAESIFEELGTPEGVAVRPDDGIVPLDTGLTPDEKDEFKKLLNAAMPLAERATRLVGLARLKGTKTAGVGLRALQEINALTGMNQDATIQAAPMFQLPPGTDVSVTITKVVK